MAHIRLLLLGTVRNIRIYRTYVGTWQEKMWKVQYRYSQVSSVREWCHPASYPTFGGFTKTNISCKLCTDKDYEHKNKIRYIDRADLNECPFVYEIQYVMAIIIQYVTPAGYWVFCPQFLISSSTHLLFNNDPSAFTSYCSTLYINCYECKYDPSLDYVE